MSVAHIHRRRVSTFGKVVVRLASDIAYIIVLSSACAWWMKRRECIARIDASYDCMCEYMEKKNMSLKELEKE